MKYVRMDLKELAKETVVVAGILTGVKIYGKYNYKKGVLHERNRHKDIRKEPSVIDVMFEEIEP